ncbi:MAG: CPBP family intramembrane metalloprotease [Candidatus Eisenbacteria sp.]|nr:CPBP family intramembrane metalloprotease [Candidatus Eisenbacteria bacterium]
MESPEYDRDEPVPSVTSAGAAANDGTTALAQPPATTVPSPREPLFGSYVSVLLYIVGYFVVGIALSMMLAVAIGLLVGLGAVQMPPIEEELAAIGPLDIEAILKVMEPYLLHLVVASGIYTILYTWAFARVFDRRRLRDLGLKLHRAWLGNLAKGAALALLILGVIFAFSLAVGSIRVEGFSRAAPEGVSVVVYLLGALLAFLSVGIYEELMFRGYILQRLNDRAGKTVSILVSSIIFAVMHGLNPGADAFGIFNTVGIGAILCVLYFRTGSLWMPIGFHTAWNFSLGYLYSLPVSGIPLYGVLNVVEIEPGSRLTGGSYGPEAGLACTVALAIWGAWLIWKRTGRGSTKGHS